MPRRWRIPRPLRHPPGYEKVAFSLPEALLDRLDVQSERWTIGPNKLVEIAGEKVVEWLEQHEPLRRKLTPIPYDSLGAAVAGAMMEAMEPVRTVPKPDTISSIDGEEIPEGEAPDYPEADAPLQEGDRPETEPKTDLLLETE